MGGTSDPVGIFLHHVRYLAGCVKGLWTIGCVYVARHAGASDGIAGRHRFRATRSSKVGPWFSCKALVLGLLLMGAAQASDRIDINTADASTLQQGLANVGRILTAVARPEIEGPAQEGEYAKRT